MLPASQLRASNIINRLILVLVFFLPLNFSFIVSVMHTAKGRLSQSAILVHGSLLMTSSQPLHLSISDVLNLIIFLSILVFLFRTKESIRAYFGKSIIILLVFCVWSAITLLINFHAYDMVRWTVCLLYLVKFFSILLFYCYIRFYFATGGSLETFVKVILVATLIAAVLGIFSQSNHFLSEYLVRDRESFYGVLSLSAIFIMSAYTTMKNNKNYAWCWQLLALLDILIVVHAVMECEKRGVVLALICAFAVLFLLLLAKKNRYVLYLFFIFGLGLVVSAPSMHQMASSILIKHKTNSWGGLGPRFSTVLHTSKVAKYIPIHTTYTITARISRAVLSSQLLKKSPIYGVGFWGVQYIYNFLPDSVYFQVLLETGLIGFIILCLWLWTLAKKTIKAILKNFFVGYTIAAAIIYFLVAGAAANIFYIFNFMGFFLVMTAVLDFYCAQEKEI